MDKNDLQLFRVECLAAHNFYRALHATTPLVWSAKLADGAQSWAEKLAATDSLTYSHEKGVAENIACLWGSELTGNKVVQIWYEEEKLYDYTDPQVTPQTRPFCQVVWANTREMGAGKAATKSGKQVVVAWYKPPLCKSEVGCNVRAPRLDKADGSPLTELLINRETLGLRKFQEECLFAHNQYRVRHGAHVLRWSPPLAWAAQQWAEELVRMGELKHNDDEMVGENLAGMVGDELSGLEATCMWYEEVEDYDFTNPGYSEDTSNFTQVVWVGSELLGVGRATLGDLCVVVAFYEPPGNMEDFFARNVLREGTRVKPTKTREAKIFIPPSPGLDTFRLEALVAHNYYRARHGTPPLVTSHALTEEAQYWAERLLVTGTTEDLHNSRIGINVATLDSCHVSGVKVTETWYNEVHNYDFDTPGFSNVTRSFTQLVWLGSKKLGVGKATNLQGQSVVVARYEPVGNIDGLFVQSVKRRGHDRNSCEPRIFECNARYRIKVGGRRSFRMSWESEGTQIMQAIEKEKEKIDDNARLVWIESPVLPRKEAQVRAAEPTVSDEEDKESGVEEGEEEVEEPELHFTVVYACPQPEPEVELHIEQAVDLCEPAHLSPNVPEVRRPLSLDSEGTEPEQHEGHVLSKVAFFEKFQNDDHAAVTTKRISLEATAEVEQAPAPEAEKPAGPVQPDEPECQLEFEDVFPEHDEREEECPSEEEEEEDEDDVVSLETVSEAEEGMMDDDEYAMDHHVATYTYEKEYQQDVKSEEKLDPDICVPETTDRNEMVEEYLESIQTVKLSPVEKEHKTFIDENKFIETLEERELFKFETKKEEKHEHGPPCAKEVQVVASRETREETDVDQMFENLDKPKTIHVEEPEVITEPTPIVKIKEEIVITETRVIKEEARPSQEVVTPAKQRVEVLSIRETEIVKHEPVKAEGSVIEETELAKDEKYEELPVQEIREKVEEAEPIKGKEIKEEAQERTSDKGSEHESYEEDLETITVIEINRDKKVAKSLRRIFRALDFTPVDQGVSDTNDIRSLTNSEEDLLSSLYRAPEQTKPEYSGREVCEEKVEASVKQRNVESEVDLDELFEQLDRPEPPKQAEVPPPLETEETPVEEEAPEKTTVIYQKTTIIETSTIEQVPRLEDRQKELRGEEKKERVEVAGEEEGSSDEEAGEYNLLKDEDEKEEEQEEEQEDESEEGSTDEERHEYGEYAVNKDEEDNDQDGGRERAELYSEDEYTEILERRRVVSFNEEVIVQEASDLELFEEEDTSDECLEDHSQEFEDGETRVSELQTVSLGRPLYFAHEGENGAEETTCETVEEEMERVRAETIEEVEPKTREAPLSDLESKVYVSSELSERDRGDVVCEPEVEEAPDSLAEIYEEYPLEANSVEENVSSSVYLAADERTSPVDEEIKEQPMKVDSYESYEDLAPSESSSKVVEPFPCSVSAEVIEATDHGVVEEFKEEEVVIEEEEETRDEPVAVHTVTERKETRICTTTEITQRDPLEQVEQRPPSMQFEEPEDLEPEQQENPESVTLHSIPESTESRVCVTTEVTQHDELEQVDQRPASMQFEEPEEVETEEEELEPEPVALHYIPESEPSRVCVTTEVTQRETQVEQRPPSMQFEEQQEIEADESFRTEDVIANGHPSVMHISHEIADDTVQETLEEKPQEVLDIAEELDDDDISQPKDISTEQIAIYGVSEELPVDEDVQEVSSDEELTESEFAERYDEDEVARITHTPEPSPVPVQITETSSTTEEEIEQQQEPLDRDAAQVITIERTVITETTYMKPVCVADEEREFQFDEQKDEVLIQEEELKDVEEEEATSTAKIEETQSSIYIGGVDTEDSEYQVKEEQEMSKVEHADEIEDETFTATQQSEEIHPSSIVVAPEEREEVPEEVVRDDDNFLDMEVAHTLEEEQVQVNEKTPERPSSPVCISLVSTEVQQEKVTEETVESVPVHDMDEYTPSERVLELEEVDLLNVEEDAQVEEEADEKFDSILSSADKAVKVDLIPAHLASDQLEYISEEDLEEKDELYLEMSQSFEEREDNEDQECSVHVQKTAASTIYIGSQDEEEEEDDVFAEEGEEAIDSTAIKEIEEELAETRVVKESFSTPVYTAPEEQEEEFADELEEEEILDEGEIGLVEFTDDEDLLTTHKIIEYRASPFELADTKNGLEEAEELDEPVALIEIEKQHEEQELHELAEQIDDEFLDIKDQPLACSTPIVTTDESQDTFEEREDVEEIREDSANELEQITEIEEKKEMGPSEMHVSAVLLDEFSTTEEESKSEAEFGEEFDDIAKIIADRSCDVSQSTSLHESVELSHDEGFQQVEAEDEATKAVAEDELEESAEISSESAIESPFMIPGDLENREEQVDETQEFVEKEEATPLVETTTIVSLPGEVTTEERSETRTVEGDGSTTTTTTRRVVKTMTTREKVITSKETVPPLVVETWTEFDDIESAMSPPPIITATEFVADEEEEGSDEEYIPHFEHPRTYVKEDKEVIVDTTKDDQQETLDATSTMESQNDEADKVDGTAIARATTVTEVEEPEGEGAITRRQVTTVVTTTTTASQVITSPEEDDSILEREEKEHLERQRQASEDDFIQEELDSSREEQDEAPQEEEAVSSPKVVPVVPITDEKEEEHVYTEATDQLVEDEAKLDDISFKRHSFEDDVEEHEALTEDAFRIQSPRDSVTSTEDPDRFEEDEKAEEVPSVPVPTPKMEKKDSQDLYQEEVEVQRVEFARDELDEPEEETEPRVAVTAVFREQIDIEKQPETEKDIPVQDQEEKQLEEHDEDKASELLLEEVDIRGLEEDPDQLYEEELEIKKISSAEPDQQKSDEERKLVIAGVFREEVDVERVYEGKHAEDASESAEEWEIVESVPQEEDMPEDEQAGLFVEEVEVQRVQDEAPEEDQGGAIAEEEEPGRYEEDVDLMAVGSVQVVQEAEEHEAQPLPQDEGPGEEMPAEHEGVESDMQIYDNNNNNEVPRYYVELSPSGSFERDSAASEEGEYPEVYRQGQPLEEDMEEFILVKYGDHYDSSGEEEPLDHREMYVIPEEDSDDHRAHVERHHPPESDEGDVVYYEQGFENPALEDICEEEEEEGKEVHEVMDIEEQRQLEEYERLESFVLLEEKLSQVESDESMEDLTSGTEGKRCSSEGTLNDDDDELSETMTKDELREEDTRVEVTELDLDYPETQESPEEEEVTPLGSLTTEVSTHDTEDGGVMSKTVRTYETTEHFEDQGEEGGEDGAVTTSSSRRVVKKRIVTTTTYSTQSTVDDLPPEMQFREVSSERFREIAPEDLPMEMRIRELPPEESTVEMTYEEKSHEASEPKIEDENDNKVLYKEETTEESHHTVIKSRPQVCEDSEEAAESCARLLTRKRAYLRSLESESDGHSSEVSSTTSSTEDSESRSSGDHGSEEDLTGLDEFQSDCLRQHNIFRHQHRGQRLIWSAELAAEADTWAEHLANTSSLEHSPCKVHGENLACAGGYDLRGDKVAEMWYDEVNDYNFESLAYNAKCGHFTQVIWRDTKEMGVAKRVGADGTQYVVARYHPPGNVLGQFRDNIKRGKGQRSSVRRRRRSSARRKSSQTSDVDDIIYQMEKFKNECVISHNYYRSIHGASPLKWSPMLAAEAQNRADKLAKCGSFMRTSDKDRGENLAFAFGLELSGRDAVDSWYDELVDYDFEYPGFTSHTGNFTQMIWAGTEEFGMGKARGEDGSCVVVGRYYPPGNHVGQFQENVNPKGAGFV